MRTVRIIFVSIALVSFFFLLGTVGAVETDVISIADGITRMFVIIPILIVSVTVAKKSLSASEDTL